MTLTIQLSDQSINELKDLCQVVLKRNAKNEISVNMAKGISDYLSENKLVTEKQALWLVRNLDFYKIERPVELVGIIVPRKGCAPPVTSSTPNSTRPTSSSTVEAFQSQIIGCLNRIEGLLVHLRD